MLVRANALIIDIGFSHTGNSLYDTGFDKCIQIIVNGSDGYAGVFFFCKLTNFLCGIMTFILLLTVGYFIKISQHIKPLLNGILQILLREP